MSYIILNQAKRILHVVGTEPQNLPAHLTAEQVSEPQAAAARQLGRDAIWKDSAVISKHDTGDLTTYWRWDLKTEEWGQQKHRVPAQVTPRQFFLALLQLPAPITTGDIDGAIDAIPDPSVKAAARVEYERALTFKRDNALIAQLAGGFSFDAEALDDIFRIASQIPD